MICARIPPASLAFAGRSHPRAAAASPFHPLASFGGVMLASSLRLGVLASRLPQVAEPIGI